MKNAIFSIIVALLIVPAVLAAEGDEMTIAGLEAEKLLNLGSCVVALVLAGLTFAAYRKAKKKRLLYITAAFLLFGIKTFLIGSEIFFGEWLWVDPVASVLDFVILAAFFAGIIKS